MSDQSDDYPPVVKLAPGKWVIAIALGADVRLSRGPDGGSKPSNQTRLAPPKPRRRHPLRHRGLDLIGALSSFEASVPNFPGLIVRVIPRLYLKVLF